MTNKFKLLIPTLMLFAGGFSSEIYADPIVIEPLFEYPVAPDNITDLYGKCNYLVEHFWDNMDFKNKNAIDQNALNDAFNVFTAPMQWADKAVAEKAVSSLIDNIKKNPTLTIQFTKAAEEALYGPRAKMWIDEIYVPFLENITTNKKVSESRKLRYQMQLDQLKATRHGAQAPEFSYNTTDGVAKKFVGGGKLSVIQFGNPDCDDCRRAKLKLETNYNFSKLVEEGRVQVLFVIPDADEDWQKDFGTLPAGWSGGASDNVADIYDIRLTPTFYVIGADGKIIAKNVPVERVIGYTTSYFSESDGK